jgi:hypothetical protein
VAHASRARRTPPTPFEPLPRRRQPAGHLPVFWVSCGAVFLANAVLSSRYGEWLPTVLGLTTAAVSFVAAAASNRAITLARRQEATADEPDAPWPPPSA